MIARADILCRVVTGYHPCRSPDDSHAALGDAGRTHDGATLATLLSDVEELGMGQGLVPCRLLVVDLLHHSKTIDPIQNMLICHHMALHLRGLRIALVVENRTGHGQKAARQLGLDLRSFQSISEAEDWLLEVSPRLLQTRAGMPPSAAHGKS